ncbi:hypothetical protein Tsp_11182 [Trichinella spiralis]|uniref:hypothetical protein n=1 Tax=Trichinella spiralis TaxID=6334 RepID=UPI0001EFECB9|nr:hypothetical protein Tsp_11182 [Trichinella spiralis]
MISNQQQTLQRSVVVRLGPKPKKTVFGKLKDKSKEKDKEKEKEQKSKSKSKQKCKNKAETVAPAAPARPVFAVPLARALCNNPSYDRVPVPAFVRRCIDYINENEQLRYYFVVHDQL